MSELSVNNVANTVHSVNPNVSIKKLISGSCLVAGTTIGAGMLGIPAVTVEAGFLPGIMASMMVWVFMLITGLLLLEVTLRMPKGSNILSITEAHLGNVGKYFAGGMFVFLYYCLVVAYIAGGSPLLEGMFQSLGMSGVSPIFYYVFFTFLIGFIVYCGVKWVDRINIVLSLLMFGAYILMLFTGSSEIAVDRLFGTANYGQMFLAVPILFGAFGYHNVVPSLCDYLQRDRKSLRLSLILGTLIAMIIYSTWQYLIIGSVDADVLKSAVEQGQTVISALQQAVGNPALFIFGKWFGALALITSLLGVSLSMVDFFADGCKMFSIKSNRVLLCILTFVPPLVFTLFNPAIFTTALGLAGGIGESVLNGLLPIALIWVSRYALKQEGAVISFQKILLMFLFLLGVGVFGIEIYDLVR